MGIEEFKKAWDQWAKSHAFETLYCTRVASYWMLGLRTYEPKACDLTAEFLDSISVQRTGPYRPDSETVEVYIKL